MPDEHLGAQKCKLILTPTLGALYIWPMNKITDSNTMEFDLKKLEVRVEELIRACAQLKDENSSLRSQQDSLVAERADLIEKTELAKTRVEAIITRLKSMEDES